MLKEIMLSSTYQMDSTPNLITLRSTPITACFIDKTFDVLKGKPFGTAF